MEGQYSTRSPAVKRLMSEARELRDPTELYHAHPLEDNLFEWHFTVRGPADSDFAGGIYHGRIMLPGEYPLKPPSIMLLTPNGRFEVNKKICLSISGFHPETWQPSWSIRTALLALIGFMPTHGAGAIGSLDYTSDERRELADKSAEWRCGQCDKCMADVLPPLTDKSKEVQGEAARLAEQIEFKDDDGKRSTASSAANSSANLQAFRTELDTPSSPLANDVSNSTAELLQAEGNAVRQRRAETPTAAPVVQRTLIPQDPRLIEAAAQSQTGNTLLIVFVCLALAALMFRRLVLVNGDGVDYGN